LQTHGWWLLNLTPGESLIHGTPGSQL